jgi:Tol biopolymer transport system component
MCLHEVARNAIYLRHGGAFCLWHPHRHRIYYRYDEEHFAALDIDTGAQRLIAGRVRQLSPGGTEFAVLMRSPHGGGQGASIGIMAEDSSKLREIVSRERLYELTPNRSEFRPDDMTLGNTKWHPDGEHLLVAMWVYPHPDARRSVYIISRDGAEARWLTHFSDHHSWTPDGKHVLFNDRTDAGNSDGPQRRMHLIDFDGSNRRVAFDMPVGSHPLMHPDGTCVLDSDRAGIYIARLDKGRMERVVEFATTFDGTHHGTHPHPVWNQDGSQVIYNSAETGHSEVYLATPT